jgi:hypothetical protein
MRVRPDVSKLGADLKVGGEKAAADAGKTSGKKFGAGMLAGVGGVLAGGALIGFFKGAFSEAQDAAKITKLTASVIKSTGGAARVSAGDVDRLATRLSNLSGVDDELIASSENVLLTFTGIRNELGKGNDIFNQGTEAALNMSAALGTDLQGATIQVGKALNDPIKGVTALQRVGVSFTAAQKTQIKTLVDSGHTMEAQKLILAELSKEFGGAAKAAATPGDRARVAWGNFEEMVGTKLLPALAKILDFGLKNQSWLVPTVGAVAALGVAIGVVSVVTKAWAAIQAVVTVATTLWTAATWALGVAVRFATGPLGIIITVIAALAAIVIYAYKHNETFRRIVDAVWKAVKVAIKAVGDWFVNVLWPSMKRAIDQAITAYHALWGAVRFVFGAVRAYIQLQVSIVLGVFNTLKKFITVTLPNAFRIGVAGIGKIWAGLQELAKRPVRFIVDTVINGAIVGTFNRISGFFGGPKAPTVSLPSGFGDGPGRPGRGAGDGFGDMFGFLRGPANWIKGRVNPVLNRVGDSPYAQMLKGVGAKLLGGLIDKGKSLLGASEIGGGGTVGTGGLRSGILSVLAALRATFGAVGVISGFRPGARTLSGRLSYHALGRAIDIAPVRAWAAFLAAAFGSRLKELITPWQEFNRLNGYPHTYTGAVWNQHNFAGGNAHIHAAMAGGGVIREPIFGVGASGRTYSFGERGPETVIPGAGRVNNYTINVSVPVGAHPAETGRVIIEKIKAFEASNGTRWRSG